MKWFNSFTLMAVDGHQSIMVEEDGSRNSEKEFTATQAGIGIQSSTLRAKYTGVSLR